MCDLREAGASFAVAALLLCGGLAGCGEEEAAEPATSTTAPVETTVPREPLPEPPPNEKPPKAGGTAEGPGGDPRRNALEREAVAAAEEYVAALDARQTGRVCNLLVPGAIEAVDLPAGGDGDCARSLESSLGYRDPRGLPVWEGSRALGAVSVEIPREGLAKVVLTVVTEFADRKEPSVEDDVIYLARLGDRWLVAKPSSTLYRAVGIADVPPSVLSPPEG